MLPRSKAKVSSNEKTIDPLSIEGAFISEEAMTRTKKPFQGYAYVQQNKATIDR